jgi:pathogenesis-related protein 1
LTKILIATVLLFNLTATKASACDPEPEKLGKEQQDYLDSHNEVRAEKGINPLVWSLKLEEVARAWGSYLVYENLCKMKHSKNPYGENLAQFWGRTEKEGPDAVESWASEEQHYNYKFNTCRAGEVCGHYTQIVWADTKEVGCATVKCGGSQYKHVSIMVCNYNPPGNYRGKRPY